MEGGGSVALPLKKNGIESGLTQLQTKWGELEKGFQDWVCKQPLPVETAAIAATRALQGAAEGLFYGTLAKSEVARQLFPSEIFGRTTLLKARSIAILRGAMVCALKRIRGGKGDTEASHHATAGIPLGPRIKILNHIERDPDMLKMQRS